MNEQNQEDRITESQSNDTVYHSLRPFPVSFYNIATDNRHFIPDRIHIIHNIVQVR